MSMAMMFDQEASTIADEAIQGADGRINRVAWLDSLADIVEQRGFQEFGVEGPAFLREFKNLQGVVKNVALGMSRGILSYTGQWF